MQDAQLIQPNNEHKLLYQQFIGVSALQQQQQQQKGRIHIDKWEETLWKEKHGNKALG